MNHAGRGSRPRASESHDKMIFWLHRPDFVHVTTRTSHDDGFIKIGAGFIVHGFSLFPARRFLIMHFRAGYSSIGEPQKITMYSPGRRRQFYNFIVSNGTFLILVKLSGTYYEPWYLFRSYEKTYSKCSSLLSSSEPNSVYQKPSGETLEERLQLTDTRSPTAITSSTDDYTSR